VLTIINSQHKTALLLFTGLFASYLALGPCTTAGRGYVYEDMESGMNVLASFNAWVKGRTVPPISWTRHGPLPLILDLPFIKMGKLYSTPDFVLSLQPIFLTAGLLTILYLWLRKLCAPGMSLFLTLAGAFGTMLWPYAYIGLETKQAFFIVLAGYLGVASGKADKWPRVLLFSTVCGLALSMKSTGIVLAPVVAYVVYVQFRGDWQSRWKHASTTVFIIAAIATINIIGWKVFWDPRGGGSFALQQWLIDSSYQFFTNAVGLFGSPAKGLFIFAPIVLVSPFAISRAFHANRETTVFALLVTGCTLTFISILSVPADELWGPRFMHVTVVPLLLIIGAAWVRFEWKRHLPLVILTVVGLAISFLGAFYHYANRHVAASAAGQSVMEWLSGDNVWNEVRFNAQLFNVWMKGGTDPVPWTATHIWVWNPPQDAPPWKTINLRDFADPQPYLIAYWKTRQLLDPNGKLIFRICFAALLVGPLLLLWIIVKTAKVRTSPLG
jgi:hypothetical protein